MQHPHDHQRILAIDPGTRHVGIAVLQDSRLIYHGVITMPHRRSLQALRRNTRALLQELLRDFRPTILAVEANAIGSSRATSRLHAVVNEIRRIGRREGLEVMTKTASTVKKLVTGDGRASKEKVARAVARCYPELKAYLRQTAKWRARYHGNMFDAVALGLSARRCKDSHRSSSPKGRKQLCGRREKESGNRILPKRNRRRVQVGL